MLKSLKCIVISLTEQTPGPETLSKVGVWTNVSRKWVTYMHSWKSSQPSLPFLNEFLTYILHTWDKIHFPSCTFHLMHKLLHVVKYNFQRDITCYRCCPAADLEPHERPDHRRGPLLGVQRPAKYAVPHPGVQHLRVAIQKYTKPHKNR